MLDRFPKGRRQHHEMVHACFSDVLLRVGERRRGRRSKVGASQAGRDAQHWSNLNGQWDFRFDAQDQGVTDKWFEPSAEGFDRKIVVPFCWESELSGIHKVKGAPRSAGIAESSAFPPIFLRTTRLAPFRRGRRPCRCLDERQESRRARRRLFPLRGRRHRGRQTRRRQRPRRSRYDPTDPIIPPASKSAGTRPLRASGRPFGWNRDRKLISRDSRSGRRSTRRARRIASKSRA